MVFIVTSTRKHLSGQKQNWKIENLGEAKRALYNWICMYIYMYMYVYFDD